MVRMGLLDLGRRAHRVRVAFAGCVRVSLTIKSFLFFLKWEERLVL
jgi:hypothetical protein